MADVLLPMPRESLLQNPDPAVPRSRSLLSRLSNPLAKHARNMFDLAIEPEDSFKVYSPGEAVKGHIVLTVLKALDVTHLVVALQGYARVYKHQVVPGDGLPVANALINGKGSKGFEYHGNGVASLFQEEQVLCCSGFLRKAVYKFAFQLHFPTKSMPSSIEFERGTVSYMITATLTRPVTMMPTHTKHQRIKFQDTLDIESFNTPKSRVVSLEPMSRRGKIRKVNQTASVGTHDTSSRGHLCRKDTQSSTVTSDSTPLNEPPLSPAPSDDTAATTATESSQSFLQGEGELEIRKPSPQVSDAPSSRTSTSAHTITATTELPRHGALPGDSIPVRVSVTHTKPFVKGFVIATLYRLGRVDMHPILPLASKGKDKQSEYEDVYPKSRTGLGGLYFSSASPSSVFRKDLSQSSTMMVVNPDTLTADITTSVKVPGGAFPTISNVPGGMISFTYHIEVVIDLFGKLTEARFLPRLTSSDPTFTPTQQAGNQLTSDWSNNILDTSQLRRTKSVVTFDMSVTVGTKDSSRKKKQIAVVPEAVPVKTQNDQDQEWEGADYGQEGHDYYYDEHGYPYYYDHGYHDPYYYGTHDEYWDQYSNERRHPPPANIIPPPEAQEELDEKTRLRRQEQLLLPSQPPQEGESSTAAVRLAPSAPMMADGVENEAVHDGIAAPSTPGPPASVTSARSADTIRPYSTSPPPVPAASHAQATDDKQELERRRLMAQASAPPTDDTEASSSRAPPSFPTAPVVTDEDLEHGPSFEDGAEGPQLPQYQQ
jgi:arrestin-related trafficking adapter 9